MVSKITQLFLDVGEIMQKEYDFTQTYNQLLDNYLMNAYIVDSYRAVIPQLLRREESDLCDDPDCEDSVSEYNTGLSGLHSYIPQPVEKLGNSQQQKVLSLNFMNRLMVLIDEYIQAKRLEKRRPSANDDIAELEQILERIQYTDESIAETRLQQVLCCKQEMRIKGKSLVCNICGTQTSINKKTNRVDRNENSSKNTSYQAIKHFDTVIKYMFMQQAEDVPSSVREELKTFMERDQKTQVTIEDVRQYLKQLTKGKGSKLNKLDATILQQLNGDQPVKLTTKEFNFIRDVYYQAVTIFYLNNTERNNTPSASYLIKCIIELLYKDYDPKRYLQLSRLIHVQKEQTVLKIQKRWKSIIKQLDIPVIKKQFRIVMEEQQLRQ